MKKPVVVGTLSLVFAAVLFSNAAQAAGNKTLTCTSSVLQPGGDASMSLDIAEIGLPGQVTSALLTLRTRVQGGASPISFIGSVLAADSIVKIARVKNVQNFKGTPINAMNYVTSDLSTVGVQKFFSSTRGISLIVQGTLPGLTITTPGRPGTPPLVSGRVFDCTELE